MREVTEALLALLSSGEAGALATVVKVTGSAPQSPGARLLLRADGSAMGTVGGGAIEKRVLEVLQAELYDPPCGPPSHPPSDAGNCATPRLISYDLGRELGMCCGGSMQIFVESIRPRPRLWIFGAGHVAEPTAALAARVGFELVVVDEREEWNSEARFPLARRELVDAASLLRREPLGARDWVLIVTHDHRLDEEALRLALGAGSSSKGPSSRGPCYIGLVGSRRKVYRLLQRVAARAGSLDLSRVYAPVGLDVGAVTPDEIAVSIVAELVALRHDVKAAGHLRAVEDGRLAELLAESAAPLGAQLDTQLGTRGGGALD